MQLDKAVRFKDFATITILQKNIEYSEKWRDTIKLAIQEKVFQNGDKLQHDVKAFSTNFIQTSGTIQTSQVEATLIFRTC